MSEVSAKAAGTSPLIIGPLPFGLEDMDFLIGMVNSSFSMRSSIVCMTNSGVLIKHESRTA